MASESHDFSTKTAVVTGSSSGLGRAVAMALAERGAAVVVHGNSHPQRAEATAAEIRAAGGEAIVLLADLADPGCLAKLVDEAWQWRSGVDIWVNNAGVDVLTGPAADWSFAEKLQRLWEVDVRACIALSRDVGQRMKHGRGTANSVILNIGWDQAEQGMAGDSGEMFSAVKGAVMAFTRSLAHSLAPEVRVNCVAPGWIRTAWAEDASEYWQERACREALLERWGTPEDVAAAVCYLAGPAAGFVTGQTLKINGGFRHGG